MEERIIQIASELFNNQITIDNKIGDIPEWDSLGQLNLFMALESKLKLKFTPAQIIENDSIVKIIKLVKQNENI